MRIGILGGGLAGVCLGYFLFGGGFDFVVLEALDVVGGLLRSVCVGGFVFDVGGSHVIFSKDREVLDLMVGVLGDNVVRRRRNSKILYRDRFVKYPFENGLCDLPKEDNFECLYYFIENLIRREKGLLPRPRNFREWCYYTFGKGIAEKYLIPYNEKIWKFPLDKIATFWVERIPQPPVEDVIKSSLGIPTEGYIHQLYFYYPKYGGIQSLAESFAKTIRKRIVTGFKVTKIRREDGRWVVSNGKREFLFDRLVSTIPLPELVKALDDVPYEVVEAVNGLKYNSLITVGIGVDKPKLNNFSWIYIPDRDILPHRVSFPSNYSSHVAPKDKSSVLAEITCREDLLYDVSDEEVSERVVEDLHQLRLIDKNDVIITVVNRFKYAYVIYDIDYKEKIENIYNFFERNGMYLLGRFSTWQYLNMDGVVKQVKDFVDNKVLQFPK